MFRSDASSEPILWPDKEGYHFDTMKGKCIQLAYNGCGRSNNVFSSKESCQKSCSCHLEPNWGVYCGKKYRIRYYYEQESGLCRKFWFSGCGGNHNRFEKKTRCEKVCTEYRGLKHEIKSLTKLIEKDLKEIQKG
ncbi:hypothetical protein FSP39_018993 [Pinctada imbricata]|uniref:BPTI/Kunitz inhibitor domain-containing protein n=1 Tax=Pinctada imbricata TaxID=66713 RepID=A0AA88Y411_PINIB|nr:hypothetical protein FSP39_018993 [Pinctada imbricata]